MIGCKVDSEGCEERASRVAQVSGGGKVMAGEVRRKKLKKGVMQRAN